MTVSSEQVLLQLPSDHTESCYATSSQADGRLIHVVQHLIEKCLLFYMDREECVACLHAHANLLPALTRTVWEELERSNAEFFAAYSARLAQLRPSGRPC